MSTTPEPKRSPPRAWPGILWLLCAGSLLLASAGRADDYPVHPALIARPERTILVLVPGMTGSMLRDRETGENFWGEGRTFMRPQDGSYGMALPIVRDPDQPPRLEAYAVLEVVRLAGVRKPVYGPLLELLVANGYRRGSLDAPRPEDTFYPFPYDWRLDNVVSARRLYRQLEEVRAARGLERLPVDLLCQSNGAYICRYLLKYGGASLEEAEAGKAGPPETLQIERVIFAGTANGGSMRILRELDRGRRYVPVIGKRSKPEAMFTFESIYQDLPACQQDLFLDADGEPVEVELYDAASWERYGWSIFSPEASKRLSRSPRPEIFGRPADRRAFLARMLDRARRFQSLLQRDVPGFPESTRYYLIQSHHTPTPARAVLVADGDHWRTLFIGDRAVDRDPRLTARAAGRGDGHATLASQLCLSPQEREVITPEPFFIDGDHFAMVLLSETWDHLLAVLADDLPPVREPEIAAE